MRILFIAQSAPGHVIPLISLQRAATAAGHETAVVTGAGMSNLVGGVPLLAVGPTMDEIMAETMRRPRGGDPSRPGPGSIELFAGTTVDLTFDDARREAEHFHPDLIVSDPLHVTAQLVAAALDVPWVSVEISAGLPPALLGPLSARAEEQAASRGLSLAEPLARVDPYPAALHGGEWAPPANRIAVCCTAFAADGDAAVAPIDFPRASPVVLLTVGTSIFERDGDPLIPLLHAVLSCDVNVILTAEPARVPAGIDPDRVRAVGFVPLAELLPHAGVVVTAGGTGTVLAVLATGLPMIIHPIKADQPINAAHAAEAGCALVVGNATDAAAALTRVLQDPSFAQRAREISAEIASAPSPRQVLAELINRMATTEETA